MIMFFVIMTAIVLVGLLVLNDPLVRDNYEVHEWNIHNGYSKLDNGLWIRKSYAIKTDAKGSTMRNLSFEKDTLYFIVDTIPIDSFNWDNFKKPTGP